MAKLAEAADSKSASRKGVWVRFPPLPPISHRGLEYRSLKRFIPSFRMVRLHHPQPFPAPLQIGPTSLRIATVPPRRESSTVRRWRAMNPLTARSLFFSGDDHDQGGGRKTSDGPVGIVASGGAPPLAGKMVKVTILRCWPSGWVLDFQSS